MSSTWKCVAALAAVLAACNSSSGDGDGGGTLARVSRGEVTAVSAAGAANKSVTVNGSTIDASAATVRIDDDPTGHEALAPGMIVTVRVDDRGGATAIDARSSLRGRVGAVGASTVTVGGAVVRVDDSTHFEDHALRLGAFASDDRVRVSGYPDDRGGLRATRIDRDRTAEFEFQVHGIVAGLDATAGTFTLALSSATGAPTFVVTLASGVTLPAGIANGSIVEVKSRTAPASGTNTLVASSVKLDDDLGAGQVQVELEGLVTSGTSASFVVSGHTVTTTAATRWSGGAPADLTPGVKVEAEGTLDGSGQLVATKVSFRENLRLQGLAIVTGTPTDAGNGSFTMFGGAVTVRVSSATRLRDGLTLTGGGFGTGPVEVRGVPSSMAANVVVATEVRLASGGGDADRIFVQGPVSEVDAVARTFKILVFTVDAAGAEFRDHGDVALTAAAFFERLANGGAVVKARGDDASALSGTTLTADEVELEED